MSVNDLLQSARYVVDESGNRKAVLLDWPAWKEFLTLAHLFLGQSKNAKTSRDSISLSIGKIGLRFCSSGQKAHQ
jgi:hypothetical protein